MKKVFRKAATILIELALPINLLAGTSYTVQPGDKIISILNSNKLGPIYGSDGSLSKIINLNPSLNRKKGDLIFPGQIIILPDNELEGESIQTMVSQEAEVPPVVNEPAQTQAINEQVSSEYPRSSLRFGLGLNYLRADIDDQTYGKEIEALSDLNWTSHLGYFINWNTRFQTGIDFSYQTYSIKDLDSGYSFENQKGNLLGLSFELSYLVTDRFRPYLGYGLKEELFFKTNSPTRFELEEIYVTRPFVGMDYTFFTLGRFSLGSGVNYKYLQSTKSGDYSVESGNQLGGYVYLTEKLKTKQDVGLKFKLGYESGKQNSQLADQKNQMLYLNVDFDLGL